MSLLECTRTYPSVKRELNRTLLIFILLVPSIITIYFVIQPRVERIYQFSFQNNLVISPFTMRYFDFGSKTEKEITLDENDLGDSFYIKTISFGFNNYQTNYSIPDYQKAFLYQASDSFLLNDNIENGQYFLRTFNIDYNHPNQSNVVYFKAPNDYHLFSIGIEIALTATPDNTITFYAFQNNVPNSLIHEVQILITDIFFNTTIYHTDYESMLTYPYITHFNYTESVRSSLLFDFSFR